VDSTSICLIFRATYYPTDPTRVWDEREMGKGIFYYEKQLNERFLSVVT
jgi:catechol 2,3-dioxygenase